MAVAFFMYSGGKYCLLWIAPITVFFVLIAFFQGFVGGSSDES